MNLGLETRSVSFNIVILLFSAGTVWFAGTRLSGFAKVLSERTRIGEAFIGTLLLGAVVSLPEAVMSITAAAMGNAALAVSTLLGGIVFSVLILAITDAVVGAEPLSSDIRHPVVPLQGALVILMLIVAAGGIAAGDVPVVGAGAWTSLLMGLYIFAIWLVKHTQNASSWVVGERAPARERQPRQPAPGRVAERSLARIAFFFATSVAAILVAGSLAAQTADALARQTGLGAGAIGFVLGGVVTSLPEASSTYSAARLQQYEMVFSDAFGTNLCSVMLLFLCDLVFSGGPILNAGGRLALFATLLGAAVTTIYVAGLIGRPRKVLFRMGIDSVLVLVMAAGGLIVLYSLR